MPVLKATKPNIMLAAQTIKQGGLVVYPTETVYGLGCDPMNNDAVKRFLEVKGNRKSPLPILTSDLKTVDKVAHVTENAKLLAEKFWPGQLTIVFNKKQVLPDLVTFGLDTVGIRIPDNNVARELIEQSGGLLVGSSANRTGENPPRTVEEISLELKSLVDVVLDGGVAVKGTSSTVVDLTSKNPRILREGPISLEQILGVLASGS
ncbi:MAG: L-threonylcarbamoyladenylate synthase [Candidatus Bathyarchaeota archaeon]|nr:L-threonylcarbamoyladenylate synthase [Candidatus Bathyarchaeota archaeon]